MVRKVDAVASIAMAFAVVVMFWGMGRATDVEGETIGKTTARVSLVYADSMGQDYPTVIAANKFAQDVKERTHGSVEVLVSNGVRDEKSIKEMLAAKKIDMARLPCNILAARPDQKMAVLSLPFLYESNEHKWRVLESDIGESAISELNSEQGLIGLAWMEEGERNFYSNVRFMKELPDIMGLIIRVQGASVFPSYWEKVGAKVAAMSTSKTYYAMKTGAVNSSENNWIVYGEESQYEMAPFVTQMRYWFIPELVVMSKDSMAKLTPQEQYIIRKCAEEAGKFQRKLFLESEKEAKKRAINGGAEIIQLTNKERDEFKQTAREVYRQYTIDHREMLSRIREMAEE